MAHHENQFAPGNDPCEHPGKRTPPHSMCSYHRGRDEAASAIKITDTDVAVIGAGVVGVCAALELQRAGCGVTLYDALPPGGGASYGNAGLISVDSCIPIALPGMLWQVPRWLLDPAGPLAIRPAYLARALPWLLRWLRAARPQQVRAAAAALHALHRPALGLYAELLGPELFSGLIRQHGQLHVWSGTAAASPADRLVDEIRARQQISVESLDAERVRALLPDLAGPVARAIAFRQHAHCVQPQQLVEALVGRLLEQGGALRHAGIQRIEPLATRGFRLWTNTGCVRARTVVVAGGAFSNRLLRPLGVRLPLETERGYHVEIPNPGVRVAVPFIHKELAVAVTPMATGLRFAGTVEFAGLDHPPDPRRTSALLQTAVRLFPGLHTDGARNWLGHRPSTPDSVPVVGQVEGCEGLYVACGHGHTGLTGAPMTGRLVAALATGRSPPIDPHPYAMARFA